MKDTPIKERFKKDIKNHSISIRMDNGVYRHIVCSNNGHRNQRFDIVTYPGYLVVSGDIGEWVFSRVDDMFEFFRRDDGGINPVEFYPDGDVTRTPIRFEDAFELNFREYTHHFLWALHAIAWAINRYDSARGKKS